MKRSEGNGINRERQPMRDETSVSDVVRPWCLGRVLSPSFLQSTAHARHNQPCRLAYLIGELGKLSCTIIRGCFKRPLCSVQT